MIKKAFSTLSLAGVTFFLSISSFAMGLENPAPNFSTTRHKVSKCEDIRDKPHKTPMGWGLLRAGNSYEEESYKVDIMTLLNPPSPEQLKLHQEEITELTQRRGSLEPFQEIEGKNKDELSTLLIALNEQFKIKSQIEMLIRKIPLYTSPYLASDPSNYFELRGEALREVNDRLSEIAVRRKEITERLELLIIGSDE